MTFHHAWPLACSSSSSGPSGWTRCWSSQRLRRLLGWVARTGLFTHAGTARSAEALMRGLPGDDSRTGVKGPADAVVLPTRGDRQPPGCRAPRRSGPGLEPGELSREAARVDDPEPLGGPGEGDVE